MIASYNLLYCIYPFIWRFSQHKPFKRSAPDYSIDYVRVNYRQLRMKDLPKVPTCWLEWDSNLRTEGTKPYHRASTPHNLMCHLPTWWWFSSPWIHLPLIPATQVSLIFCSASGFEKCLHLNSTMVGCHDGLPTRPTHSEAGSHSTIFELAEILTTYCKIYWMENWKIFVQYLKYSPRYREFCEAMWCHPLNIH